MSDLTAPANTSAAVGKPNHHRYDIQGLRAIAVVLVVADHLLGWPKGGFIGVDVFFVISGFLITGLLLREHARNGRISFASFYKRRLKRTVPAALLVIAVTLIVGYFLLATYQYKQVLVDGLASATFVSNWRYIAIGTDYLHAADALSPLQHYWSLAVEEQFYLVWPAVLAVALFVAQRRRWSARRTIGIALAIVAIASFAWSMWETRTNPTTAYFSTPSRIWELAAGGLIATLAGPLSRMANVIRTPLSWVGLAILAVASLQIGPDSAFPGPYALLPVLGTVFILAAGEGAQVRDIYPLTNPLSAYIGKLSYSIYLWHFPIIVLGATLLPARGEKFIVLSVVLTLVVSIASYHWVEEPFRSRPWRDRKRRQQHPRPTRRTQLALASLLTIAAVLAASFFVLRTPTNAQAAPLDGLLPTSPSSAVEQARTAEITAALSADSWPELTPAPAELGDKAFVPEWIVDGCLNGGLPVSDDENAALADKCIYGDPSGEKTIVLFGDSIALSYVPGLREALPDWRIEVLTIAQCPANSASVHLGDGSAFPACDTYREWAQKRIADIHPDAIVASSSTLSIERLASNAIGADALTEWQLGATAMVNQLAPSTERLVVLDAPPLESSPQSCKSPIKQPTDCIAPVRADYAGVTLAQRAGVTDASATNVIYPRNLTWFCSDAGQCPSFIGSIVTLADGMHLTDAGARQLAPILKHYVLGASR